jgi:hypothetical protein
LMETKVVAPIGVLKALSCVLVGGFNPSETY